jgi:hypothetical protein
VTGNIGPGGGELDVQAQSYAQAEAAGSGFPQSDSIAASLTYTLTVYPGSLVVGQGLSTGITTNTPVLGINYDGTNIVLSWPIIYPNYLLTTITNLACTNWTVVPTPPSIVGSLWEVTNSALMGTQFYRLLGQ